MKSAVVTLLSATLALSVTAAAGADEGGLVHANKGNCSGGLRIRKEAPRRVREGERFEYEIRVRNEGTCDLLNVEVEDHLPRGVEFIDAYPRPSRDRDADDRDGRDRDGRDRDHHRRLVEWEHFSLNVGESRSFQIRVEAEKEEGDGGGTTGRIRNEACAFDDSDGRRVCDEVTTEVEYTPPPVPIIPGPGPIRQ